MLDLRRVELPGGEWNAAVLQCELQVCDSPDELHKAARPLRTLLDSESADGLGAVFAAWISGVLLPAMGVEDVLKSDRLEEVLDMLGTKRKNWAERLTERVTQSVTESVTERVRHECRVEFRDEGRVEGRRELIVKLAGERFGSSVTRKLATLLQAVSDPEKLDDVGVRLVSVSNVDDLLAGLGNR